MSKRLKRRAGHTRLSANNQVTLPRSVVTALGLAQGAELRVEARGDVVVLNPPTPSAQPYIKRIIGLPGESIEFRNGFVYIDGERLDEPYIEQGITRCGNSDFCSIDEIPDGYVYVLGDNRNNSSDSRSFGLVAIDRIVGKAWFTNWPLADIGLVPHYDYQE